MDIWPLKSTEQDPKKKVLKTELLRAWDLKGKWKRRISHKGLKIHFQRDSCKMEVRAGRARRVENTKCPDTSGP